MTFDCEILYGMAWLLIICMANPAVDEWDGNCKGVMMIASMFSFRNYNASKYSSSCVNTLGDFLKNATTGTNTSSGGFSSAETNTCRQEKDHSPAGCDLNSRSFSQPTSTDVNMSGCKDTAQRGDYQQHHRCGSSSVTKDSGLDFSHVQENGMPEKHANAEQSKRIHRTKNDASRSKSLGDIVEPLNSDRLRPIRQKTRNAVVSILDDGEVALEFFHHKNGEDRVCEVLRISQNGMKIAVHQPNGKTGVSLSSQPPPPAGCESTCAYLFSNLPSKFWKKYQYATRFVHLVRKKTPKVRVLNINYIIFLTDAVLIITSLTDHHRKLKNRQINKQLFCFKDLLFHKIHD